MDKAKKILCPAIHYKNSTSLSFLLLLVSADFVFIALHYIEESTSLLNNYLFAITEDHSYGEMYQYIKEFWIIILFLTILIKTKKIGYIAWALLFTYLLCDDVMLIHERVGSIIANCLCLPPFFHLRPRDFGELAVILIAAVCLLPPIWLFYLRSSSTDKKVTIDLLFLLIFVAFFGVFIDIVHVAINFGRKVELALGTIEDGGEMITISIFTWYVFLLNISIGNAHLILDKNKSS